MKFSFPSLQKEVLFSTPFMLVAMAILLLPLCFITPYFYLRSQHLQDLHDQVELIYNRISRKKDLFKNEEKLLHQISQSDPNYLENSIESIPLLETEKQKWQIFSSHLETNKAIRNRMQFLEEGKNQLSFSEGEIRKSELFQEIEEKLQKPVELNEDDLKKLLCNIEGVRIHPYFPKEHAPQFIIKLFDLTKKSIPETKEKIFTLNLQLIQREGVPTE